MPNTRLLTQAEFILLCLFSIALPLVEAPKNIFWGLFLLLWLGNSLRQRNFGQLSRGWDLLFACLIAAPLLSIAASSYAPQWKEMGDIAGYVSLGWILARSRMTVEQLKWLLACLIGATLVGVVQGYWVLQMDPKREWLQLNSVGHVNHSALYAAGIGVIAAGVAACGARKAGRRAWLLGIASAIFMFGAMIVFASRGALVAYLAGALPVLLLVPGIQLRRVLPIAASILVVGLGIGLLADKLISGNEGRTLVSKTMIGLQSGNLSSYRLQAVNTAIEMLRKYPLTGVGAANFSAVSPEELGAWVKARGQNFDRDAYFFSSHAHGVYANTLGERGLLGISTLLMLMLAWARLQLRTKPRADSDTTLVLAWSMGAAGWSVVFVGGLFNTTLHHEHGMLAMVCLGILLSESRAWNPPTAS